MQNLTLNDLNYEYPEELVATEPSSSFRTMLVQGDEPKEVTKQQVLAIFEPGDLLLVNDTKVLKRRVFSDEGFEILFLNQINDLEWQVLFPARRLKKDQVLELPQGVKLELVQKGIPQTVRLDQKVSEDYFTDVAELALPPYIQKARDSRHNISADEKWYQTAWAERAGSFAAPTASLHFDNNDLEHLQSKGVAVSKLTLHVGLGTFLPIKTEDLSEHKMHTEYCYIPQSLIEQVGETKQKGGRVFALGTTATRAIESWAHNKLQLVDGAYVGETDLFITPGFEYKVVDVLMTNFHQPKSTLLALVGGFIGLEKVQRSYQWAIEKKFKLFSYGDFSIWMR